MTGKLSKFAWPRLSLRCFLILAAILPIGFWGLYRWRVVASKDYLVFVTIETGWKWEMKLDERAQRLGLIGEYRQLHPGGAIGNTASGIGVISYLGGNPVELPATRFSHPKPCTWWNHKKKLTELERELDVFVRRNPDLAFGRVDAGAWVRDPDPNSMFMDRLLLGSLDHHPAARQRLKP